MKLADYQRALVTHVLGVAPEPTEALGAHDRLTLYREMVQRRLRALVRFAFRSLVSVVGEARFDASWARFLAAAPPRTPLLRDAAHAFGAFALGDRALLAEGPAYLPALIAFEACVWRAAYAESAPQEPSVSLDFALPPVFHAGAQLLRLSHPVQRVRAQQDHHLPERPTVLWIYRDAQEQVRFAETSALMAELCERAQRDAALSLTQLVTESAHALTRPVDESLLSELADALSRALSLEVLRGSRPAER